MPTWQTIAAAIAAATGQPCRITAQRPVGGGCINNAYVVESDAQRWFVKTNRAARLAMFDAEADGLRELASSRAIRVPQPVCHGVAGDSAFLVLEYVEFGATGTQAETRLGEQLAALHRVSAAQFGWRRDNSIGATPQPNTPDADWATFWRARRLGFQLDVARRNGAARLADCGAPLLDALPAFFTTYRPVPALLHGDLWSGNRATDTHGQPLLFDPAVYYGDRETDLAMSELFGGFAPAFYAAYRAAWPLDPGYATRRTLYNLYHVLNHYNMFGGGYQAQAERMIATLLAELR